MSSSVYSIVLQDEVVSAIDKLSFTEHTSRSNMINRILAQKVGLVTREGRIDDIFAILESFVSQHSQLASLGRGDAYFAARSAIQYKYNPSVRYIVELTDGEELCRLRVSLRTQNSVLIAHLNRFFSVWLSCESEYAVSQIEDGRFTRYLNCPKSISSAEQAGFAISEYISLFDKALKAYFDALPSTEFAALSTKQIYQIGANDIILQL